MKEKYPVGSHWLMRNVKGFEKGDFVTIQDNGVPGKDRELIVVDDVGVSHKISVKDLWKRVD